MKKVLTLAIASAAILILVGCESNVAPETPLVTSTVADSGATLALSWSAVAGADGYIIYADDTLVDTISTTTYAATIPAKKYAVSAYAGIDESATQEIDCSPVVTESLIVYSSADSDSTQPNGFGFNTSGTAVAYLLTDTASYPLFDYWIQTDNDTMQFVSPNQYPDTLNDEVNVTKNSGGTSFDAEDICDAPGGYTTPTAINANAVYFFWIDPTNNNWDATTDHFGKIKIKAIDGMKVTLELAYQPVAGLRWVVTP